MSLSFLLGSSKAHVDKELDSLFQSSTNAAATPGKDKKLKRKLREGDGGPITKKKIHTEATVEAEGSTKQRKKGTNATSEETIQKARGKSKGRHETSDSAVQNSDVKRSQKKEKDVKKETKKLGQKQATAISGSEEKDNADLEDAYLTSKTSGKASSSREKVESKAVQQDSDSESDQEGDPSALVHESLEPKKSKGSKKSFYVPEDETPEQRNARTIFIGNVPLEVAQKRTHLKQLHRHILFHLPNAKIESSRVRSVPFQNPTSKLPDDAVTPSKSKPSSSLEGRSHDRERAASWRQQQAKDEDAKASEDPSKHYLTTAQKKKLAFINQSFHSEADSINVYIVFAHPPVTTSENLPVSKHTMGPYEAAVAAKEKCDGVIFMERILRVDVVGKTASGDVKTSADGNPKLSVFIGNLDFAAKEEDLRAFIEGVIVGELGPRERDEDKDEEQSTEKTADGNVVRLEKPNFWVTRVRIVRDKETQLGKGFAYVQFASRECVDEILALEESKLNFAKRTLRVQRCKTLPSSSGSIARPTSKYPSSTQPSDQSAPASIPKGDPSLGKKLAHLNKEERKAAKAGDADRVKRRLAKKKARMGMEKVMPKNDVGGKERNRVRKPKISAGGHGTGSNGKKKSGKAGKR